MFKGEGRRTNVKVTRTENMTNTSNSLFLIHIGCQSTHVWPRPNDPVLCCGHWLCNIYHFYRTLLQLSRDFSALPYSSFTVLCQSLYLMMRQTTRRLTLSHSLSLSLSLSRHSLHTLCVWLKRGELSAKLYTALSVRGDRYEAGDRRLPRRVDLKTCVRPLRHMWLSADCRNSVWVFLLLAHRDILNWHATVSNLLLLLLLLLAAKRAQITHIIYTLSPGKSSPL